MIVARICKHKGEYKSFSFRGHAEYDEEGRDIVCAAVSMLVINTANALQRLTGNRLKGSNDDGIWFEFTDAPDESGRLLIDTMLMGLEDVQKKYGKGYIKLISEEV
ncbi:MAG TPA: ribosomal-processing cysteine protease Prp [Lachnospiraceae bacterium]|nr:ribosomal-processing cysteine protease Prp [Lachnospiraceae bacterium]